MLFLGLGIVFAIGVLCAYLMLTGFIKREYQVLPADEIISLADQTVTIEELAATYQPMLFMPQDAHSPPALKMWWEAIRGQDFITLIYHPMWQDETHPIPFIHWLYALYRGIYYGMPVRDIEYIQINIDLNDGSIQRVRYEDTLANEYNAVIAGHQYITITRDNNHYIKWSGPEEQSLSQTGQVTVTGPQLSFGIATWSHQLTMLTDDKLTNVYPVPVDMPLAYLTDGDYAKYKLARRSQGDFITKENPIAKKGRLVLYVLILGLPWAALYLKNLFKKTR